MNGTSEGPPVPPGYFQVEGRTPDGEGAAWFLIPQRMAEHFLKTGNRSKFLECALIPDVLKGPTGIWHDLKRDEMKDGLCYCGLPKGRRLATGIEVPIPPGKVFAVFVGGQRARGGQYVVQKTNWVQECGERDGFPVDHEERFGRRLWPQD